MVVELLSGNGHSESAIFIRYRPIRLIPFASKAGRRQQHFDAVTEEVNGRQLPVFINQNLGVFEPLPSGSLKIAYRVAAELIR